LDIASSSSTSLRDAGEANRRFEESHAVLHPHIRSVLVQLEEATHTQGGLLLVREACDPWPVTWGSGAGLLLNADGDSLTREPTRWWAAVLPADRERLRAALESPAPDQVLEYRVRSPQAGLRWVRESMRRVETLEGGVSLVSVVRDVTLEREADSPVATRPATLDPGTSAGHGDVVLLVEDDDAVRAVLARVLAREGFPTLLAGNAAEALRIYDRAPREPAILVTDVILPDRTGPVLARALARRRPHLPVLFISGYAVEDLERRGDLPVGMALLPKPFTPADLVQAIRSRLAGEAARAAEGSSASRGAVS
jgi:CheY-like chemotaxis protein